MINKDEHLQQLVNAYWLEYATEEELPHWFYIMVNLVETRFHRRFNIITGFWKEV